MRTEKIVDIPVVDRGNVWATAEPVMYGEKYKSMTVKKVLWGIEIERPLALRVTYTYSEGVGTSIGTRWVFSSGTHGVGTKWEVQQIAKTK